MIRPELEEAKKISEEQEFQVIPISMELYSDLLTPIEVLRKLKNVSKHCYLLESAEDNQNWGRYTFLGYDPKLELTCVDGKVTITAGTKITMETKHPKEQIKQIIEENKSPRFSYLPTFTGGLVGYFSYDYIKYAENSLDLDAEDTEGFRDVDLMLFDKVIAFDHYRQKIILIVNAKCSDIETEYHRALLELESMKNLILKGKAKEEQPGKLKTDFKMLFQEKEYCSIVEKAKNYIREGDIFQVVLSNRMEAEYEGSLLNAYRVLRTTNPSPYMFYFSSDDLEIAGASPETLVKLEDGVVHTFPLAGTLSGAPKIRACEIINELENNKRGIYGGAIGYIDFTGNLDTCIAIRIAYKKNGKVFIRSGAGIVADSVPKKEYEECLNKAKAVKMAIQGAEGFVYCVSSLWVLPLSSWWKNMEKIVFHILRNL